MLVHPQLAVWDFFGRRRMQLIAATSASGGTQGDATAIPNDVAIAISELSACETGGNPYSFQTATRDTETLSPEECRSLARLDPFYGHGQSANLNARAQLLVGAQEYGVLLNNSMGVRSLDIQMITSNQHSVTNQHTASYAATVEEILSTEHSAGTTLTGKPSFTPPGGQSINLGLSEQVTLKKGSSLATTMTLLYKNSSATMHRNEVSIVGSVNDQTNRAYNPRVEIYQDDSFGGLLFRDPDAPCMPMPTCTVASPADPGTTPLSSH